MFLAKPRLAISQLQWTQAKKTPVCSVCSKVRADVGVESYPEAGSNCLEKSLVAGRDSQIFPQNDQFLEAENNESWGLIWNDSTSLTSCWSQRKKTTAKNRWSQRLDKFPLHKKPPLKSNEFAPEKWLEDDGVWFWNGRFSGDVR